MDKSKKMDKYNVPFDDNFGELPYYDDTMNVVSDTECTGMVPTPPFSDGEADSYREIYDVPVERNRTKNPYVWRKIQEKENRQQ